MRSADKLDVAIESMPEAGGKLWVRVSLRGSRRSFFPSFEDLARIVIPIIHCENVKYRGLSRPPSDKVAVFLLECREFADRVGSWPPDEEKYERWWRDISARYQIPERQENDS